VAAIVSGDWWAAEAYRRKSLTTPSLNRWRSRVRCSPGNADLSDEAAGVSNDEAKSENADIAASAGNGKRRAPNAKR
jgi:hypothetical protein